MPNDPRIPPTKTSDRLRSRSFPGMAAAAADQWGGRREVAKDMNDDGQDHA